MDPQVTPQDGRQATQFVRGRSGNPSGRARWQSRFVELCSAFQDVHGRGPLPLELVSLRAAARLASAAENPRTSSTESVRANNTLHRVLKRLGLASPPARRPAKSPLQSLDEHLAATHGGSR